MQLPQTWRVPGLADQGSVLLPSFPPTTSLPSPPPSCTHFPYFPPRFPRSCTGRSGLCSPSFPPSLLPPHSLPRPLPAPFASSFNPYLPTIAHGSEPADQNSAILSPSLLLPRFCPLAHLQQLHMVLDWPAWEARLVSKRRQVVAVAPQGICELWVGHRRQRRVLPHLRICEV
eukprot:258576-Chlamydomonas_euryale.AAC.1